MKSLSLNNDAAAPDSVLKQAIIHIFEGQLDFTIKERCLFSVIGCAAAYFSWEASKVFLDLGGKGTPYLPIGTFTEEFGGHAAFWTVASCNWYFMMYILILARHGYYQHQLAKQLGVATPLWKIIFKQSIALVMAATAGIVMSLIAKSQALSFYNSVVTGIFYIALNYIGCVALENALIAGAGLLGHQCCKRSSKRDHSHYTPHDLPAITTGLRKFQNTHPIIPLLKSAEGYYAHVTASHSKTPLLNKKAHLKPKTKIKYARLISHLLIQTFGKITIYGYYRATVDSVAKLFRIQSLLPKFIVGSLFFIVILSLSTKVLYETVNDLINLVNVTVNNMFDYAKRPYCNSTVAVTVLCALPAAALVLLGYYLSYITSNISLAFNAQYDWHDWWNIYPTCIGSVIYDGFGFLQIFMALTSATIRLLLYSPDKRLVNHRHNQFCNFFSKYPQLAVADNKQSVLELGYHQ